MKKIIFGCMMVLFAYLFATPITANAEEEKAKNKIQMDYGEPISEISYEDEDGNKVTERIYFVASDNESSGARATSSIESGWYRNEKTIEWSAGTITVYFAEGFFEWDGEEVSVSYPTGGYDNMPGNITVSEEVLDYGTGRYGLIFNKYAYVTFSFVTTDISGTDRNRSVTIRISQNGNNI